MDGLCQEVPDCFVAGAALKLRERFRLLWEQHVYWTRLVIIAIAAGSPDLEATTRRLLRNAPDMGRLFGRFYGGHVAAEFSRLIRDHLTIAAELVNAAKADEKQAAADAERRWYENGAEIVCFLVHINPWWSDEELQAMWNEHLALTKAEAVARLKGDFSHDIEVFDRIEREALMMADAFSCGISRQFEL